MKESEKEIQPSPSREMSQLTVSLKGSACSSEGIEAASDLSLHRASRYRGRRGLDVVNRKPKFSHHEGSVTAALPAPVDSRSPGSANS